MTKQQWIEIQQLHEITGGGACGLVMTDPEQGIVTLSEPDHPVDYGRPLECVAAKPKGRVVLNNGDIFTYYIPPPVVNVTVTTPEAARETAMQMGVAVARVMRRIRHPEPARPSAAELAAQQVAAAVLQDTWTDRKITRPKPAKPAPLHALQRMSDQPSSFGQSMWKPWEK